MRIGIALPVRELQDDIGAIKAFAQAAEELDFTHLRVPEQETVWAKLRTMREAGDLASRRLF